MMCSKRQLGTTSTNQTVTNESERDNPQNAICETSALVLSRRFQCSFPSKIWGRLQIALVGGLMVVGGSTLSSTDIPGGKQKDKHEEELFQSSGSRAQCGFDSKRQVHRPFNHNLPTSRLNDSGVPRQTRASLANNLATVSAIQDHRRITAQEMVGTLMLVGLQNPPVEVWSNPSLFTVVNDSLLVKVLYNYPGRMASQIAADGAVGVNASWEAGRSSTWYIEEQRYGADLIQAGLVNGNPDLVQQGWQILDWGFSREAMDGSFPTTGDPFHSTSMFVEAGSRALLLEIEAGTPDAAQRVAKYLPKVAASARWLMSPNVATKGIMSDAPYTHRRWLLAAALGQVSALTGDPATASAAAAYAQRGLAMQMPNGMDPENGGGDSSYQAYGILLAERYFTVCQDQKLSSQILNMINLGLDWEEGFINAAGQVSIIGSTRTGIEPSRGGTPKTIDYKSIIQAFSVASTLTGDSSYRLVAQEVAQGRGWIGN